MRLLSSVDGVRRAWRGPRGGKHRHGGQGEGKNEGKHKGRLSQGEASTREKPSASGLRPSLFFGRVWAMVGGRAPNPRGTAEVLPGRGGGREPAPRTAKSQSDATQPSAADGPGASSPSPRAAALLWMNASEPLGEPRGTAQTRGRWGGGHPAVPLLLMRGEPSERHFSKRGFQELPGTSSFPWAGGCCWVCPSPDPRRPRGRRLKDEEQSPKTPSPAVFGCCSPIALCPLSPRHSPGPPSSRVNPKR